MTRGERRGSVKHCGVLSADRTSGAAGDYVVHIGDFAGYGFRGKAEMSSIDSAC